MEGWIISRRRPDCQGVALRWENAWAFGPQVVWPARLVCPECHPFTRPACFPAFGMDLISLASLVCPEVCAPKGRRFAQRRATPWLRKTSTAPPFFHRSVVRPNGPTIFLRCGLFSGRRRPVNTPPCIAWFFKGGGVRRTRQDPRDEARALFAGGCMGGD
jgi:hypothetical protein